MSTVKSILIDAEQYVQQLLLHELSSHHLYHNFEYALEIVEVCQEIGENSGLSKEERTDLALAAWFWVSGFTRDELTFYVHSATFARNFLESHAWDPIRIQGVEQLILNAGKGAEPHTDLERVFHDGRWSFLGRKRFFRRANLLRLEKENLEGKKYSLYDWQKYLLDLQLTTKFYTPYAQQKFASRRNKNIARQRKELLKAREQNIRLKTGKEFGRGVDTVYRVTLNNHISLSSIADGKANMIISINSVVISVIITGVTAGLSVAGIDIQTLSWVQNLNYVVPLGLLLLSSLTAIVFAVLSAIPKVSSDPLDEEKIKNHQASMLYFGNFIQMDRERFVDYLRDLKKDQEVLYDDLSRDLYNLGKVLMQKYTLLTYAYRIYVVGLVISVLTFVVLNIWMM